MTLGNIINFPSGFTNDQNTGLIEFIVKLIILTEVNNNADGLLTAKQIVELYSIGITISKMYELTVLANHTDVATFLNAIPLGYGAETGSSVIDEIIDLKINDTLRTYIGVMTHTNEPILNCWAFGSVNLIIESLFKASKIDSAYGQLTLKNLSFAPAADDDKNSFAALWLLFNGPVALPITINNVERMIVNYLKLDAFLTNSWNENKTFAVLVDAGVPIEVILFAEYGLVSNANGSNSYPVVSLYETTSKMNALWNFLTNSNTGTSVVPLDTIGTKDIPVKAMTFKTALQFMNKLGFSFSRIMNVNVKKLFTYSDEVSVIVELLRSDPTLVLALVSVYQAEWTNYSGDDNYLVQAIARYNLAVVAWNKLSDIPALTNTPTQVIVSSSSSFVMPSPPVLVHDGGNLKAAQITALQNLKFAWRMLNFVNEHRNLVFRATLNGHVQLSTLTLEQAAKFMVTEDTYSDLMNIVTDSAGYVARDLVFATVDTNYEITPAELYLFNRVMATGVSDVVANVLSTVVGKTVITNVVINFESLLKQVATTKNFALIKGDGELFADETATLRSVIERVIKFGYKIATQGSNALPAGLVLNSLYPTVQGLGDYAEAGVIGRITDIDGVVGDIDNLLFTEPNALIKRVINSVGATDPTDYNKIADVVTKIVAVLTKSTVPINDVLETIVDSAESDADILSAIGGDIFTAVVTYGKSLKKASEIANFLNWVVTTAKFVFSTLTETINNVTTVKADETVVPRLVAKMLFVANETKFDLGTYLMSAITSGITDIIKNVTEIVNLLFANPQGQIDYTDALSTVTNSFFKNLVGLAMTDIQDHVTIKKLMYFYNNMSNPVITYVCKERIPLGLWAKYVNIQHLAFVINDDGNIGTNYDVEELLSVYIQVTIFDYASGSGKGIEVRQLITADMLVQAGVLSAINVPDFIDMTAVNGSNLGPSQAADIERIAVVAQAMDWASGTTKYTDNLKAIIGDVSVLVANSNASVAEAIIVNRKYTVGEILAFVVLTNNLFTVANITSILNFVSSRFDTEGKPNTPV